MTGPALTPDQRAALDVLTERRRAFVLAYVGEAQGNALEAARIAGYAKPHPEGARLLQTATVATAIEALRAPAEQVAIATVEELRTLWSRWARDGAIERTVDGKRVPEPLPSREMIKATELLAKSQGAFIERREISGPDGAPLEPAPVIRILATTEYLRHFARDDTNAREMACPTCRGTGLTEKGREQAREYFDDLEAHKNGDGR